jgi:arginyl-tRNA--protein-N-Asp/Glu arginylyltransferase
MSDILLLPATLDLGELAAVSCVDVLPRCVHCGYMFWDPPLKHLVLGKLTALYELLWVRQVSRG